MRDVFDRESVEDVKLLLASQLDEVDGVAGDANGEVRVVLRVLHRILKGVAVQDVDVGVVQALDAAVVLALRLHGGEALFVRGHGGPFLRW